MRGGSKQLAQERLRGNHDRFSVGECIDCGVRQIAEQVIARARKLVEEDEAARKAVEELRRRRGQ